MNTLNEALQGNKKPKVAILLAAYNGTLYLSEQISSILSQTNVHPIIFISIDVSTDETEYFVENLAASNAQIKILPTGLRFGGAARNFYRLMRDVDFSYFDYVAFSDQDDIWHADKLFRAHSVLTKGNISCYSSNVIAFWKSGKEVLINKSQPQKSWDFLFEAAGPGCTYVMKVDFAKAVQSKLISCWAEVQDVALHDWLVYAYARANGYNWFIDEFPSMHYRQHEVNQVGANTGLRAFKSRARKILNGEWFYQAALIAKIVGVAGTPFVARSLMKGRLGFLYLAVSASSCRRRLRDIIFFMMSCLFLGLFHKPK